MLDIVGLLVRAAGVVDVKCLVSSWSYEPLGCREAHTLCAPCGTWTYAMCILWSYSTAVVSYTSRTECKIIKCFILAQCWQFIGYFAEALLADCHALAHIKIRGVSPNYSGTNNCLIPEKASTKLKSIRAHSAGTGNWEMFLCFSPAELVKWMEASPHIQSRKAPSLLHGAAHWRKAVIYHNYASGPISSDPLAVILECAVVLSAFHAERERSWCDGVRMSRVVVSVCDVFQSKPLALCFQRLWMHPSACPLSFNGPINWNWGYLSKCKHLFSLLYAWFTGCIYSLYKD